MLSFIRIFFLYFNCIQILNCILNHSSRSLQYKRSFQIIFAFLAALLNAYVHFPILSIIINLLPPLFITLLEYAKIKSLKVVVVSLSLSLALSHFSLVVAITVIAALTMPAYHFLSDNKSLIILSLIMGLLQTILLHLLLGTKRLRNGMPYLYSTNFLNLGLALSLCALSSYLYGHLMVSLTLKELILLTWIPFICFFLLLHWWQSQLTKAYRKRLAQMELESLRTELEQKSILLKKLEAQNEEMGRLIHKDNKLIPAMEHAVSTYLTSDFTDLTLQQAQGEALLTDLKELSAARQGILSTFTPSATPKYETGIPSLDAILVYMYQKAQSNGIRFYATATQESIAKCPTKLTNEKLVHLLSDLLENAIIATKSSSDKQIQLQIYLANGIFTIEIADTGLSFEPATLISFGLEKASTHLKDGGSGIGLLDIWEIKEEVKASIHIHEYETGTPFSKKIFISFDNRNKYVIHTWRDKELAPLVNRGDLVLLSQNQQTA